MDKWNEHGGLTLIINLLTLIVAYVVGGCIAAWAAPVSTGWLLTAIHGPAAIISLGTIILRDKLDLP